MLAPQRRAGCKLHAWQLPASPVRLRAVRSQAVSATRRTANEAQGRRTEKTEAQRLSKVWGAPRSLVACAAFLGSMAKRAGDTVTPLSPCLYRFWRQREWHLDELQRTSFLLVVCLSTAKEKSSHNAKLCLERTRFVFSFGEFLLVCFGTLNPEQELYFSVCRTDIPGWQAIGIAKAKKGLLCLE